MEKLIPTLRNLKKIGRKPIETEPYAKYIVRPISIYFTWLIVRSPLSANNITFLQIIVGCLGALFLAFPYNNLPIYGVLLIQISYILDCVDGEVARWKNLESDRGIYLDLICHTIIISLYMFCFGYGLWNVGFTNAVIFGAGASLCSFKIDDYAYIRVSNKDIKETKNLYKSGLVKFFAFYRFPSSMNFLTIALLYDYYIYGTYGLLSYTLLVAFCIALVLGRIVQIINNFYKLQ